MAFGSFRYCNDCWRFYCIHEANQSQLFNGGRLDFCMPAQWTGEVVGKIHNNQLTAKELAKEIGWNDKYLSQVLNSENPPKDAEQKVNDALNRIIERREHF